MKPTIEATPTSCRRQLSDNQRRVTNQLRRHQRRATDNCRTTNVVPPTIVGQPTSCHRQLSATNVVPPTIVGQPTSCHQRIEATPTSCHQRIEATPTSVSERTVPRNRQVSACDSVCRSPTVESQRRFQKELCHEIDKSRLGKLCRAPTVGELVPHSGYQLYARSCCSPALSCRERLFESRPSSSQHFKLLQGASDRKKLQKISSR